MKTIYAMPEWMFSLTLCIIILSILSVSILLEWLAITFLPSNLILYIHCALLLPIFIFFEI